MDNLLKYWKEIALIVLSVILIIFAVFHFERVGDLKFEKERWEHNSKAAIDTITYYKDRNGNLYAEKLAYIATVDELKILNRELHDNIEVLNRKVVAGVNTRIIVHDSIAVHDTVIIDNTLPFQEKIIRFSDSILSERIGIGVYPDRIITTYVDYTLSLPLEIYLTKDKSVIVKSVNNATFPYINSYVDPSLFQPPREKKWSVGVGFGAGFHYGLFNRNIDVGPYLGLQINYKLF
jgi:hypothetical protein